MEAVTADGETDVDAGKDAAAGAITLPLIPCMLSSCTTGAAATAAAAAAASIIIVRHGCALAGCGSLVSAKRTHRPWCAGAHCPCAEAARAESLSAGGGDESAHSACSAEAAESKCKTTAKLTENTRIINSSTIINHCRQHDGMYQDSKDSKGGRLA